MVGHVIYTNKFSTDIDAFQEVAENTKLSKSDLRVFMFLCCRMGSKHLINIDKKQISETLDISKKDVEDSLSKLMKHGIIMRDSDEHLKKGYRMSYTENGPSGSDDFTFE